MTAEPEQDAAQAGIRRTWQDSPLAVKALVAGLFVNRLGGFLQIYLVLYMVQRGFSTEQASSALGAYGLGSVFGLLIGGWASDRFGTRRAMIAVMAATAGLTVAVVYAPNYPTLLAVTAAVGASGQSYRPISANLVSRLTPPRRRVMVFAIYRLALNLGTTAAPLLGVALVAFSYNLLFWAEAVAALACAAISTAPVPPQAPHTDDDGSTERPGPAATRRGYLNILADHRYVLFLLAMLVYSLVYIQYVSTLPLQVRANGYPTAVYGVLVAVNGLVVISCELLVTKVVQGWPARTATVVGMALLSAGVSLYWFPWGVAGLVAATLVWSVGETVGAPTMVAYPARAAPPALRGRYMGAAQAMFGIGSAAGPVLGVVIASHIGGKIWLACGAAGLAAICAATYGVRPDS